MLPQSLALAVLPNVKGEEDENTYPDHNLLNNFTSLGAGGRW
jgi:hypothetical protein